MSEAPTPCKRIVEVVALVVVAVSLALLAVTYRSYRQLRKDVEDMQSEAVLQGLDLSRRHVSPVSARPMFIVREPKVAWDTLAPNAAWAWGDRIPRKLLGTFPVPGRRPVGDAAAVTVDEAGLTLPAPGEYYLHTSMGFFKLLYLSAEATDTEAVEAVAAFVSRNTLHCLADGPAMQPAPLRLDYQRPENLLAKFFATDQPLRLHCYQSAEFLGYLFDQLGYEVRQVQLYEAGEDKPVGRHAVCEVRLPGEDRWIMLDADYGAAVADAAGRWLAVAEIATADPAALAVVDLAGKRKLKRAYSQPVYMPDFTWRPDLMAEQPTLDAATYRDLLHRITHEYWTLDHDAWFQLVNCRRFRRDGTELDG
jgi:hypothetical protein